MVKEMGDVGGPLYEVLEWYSGMYEAPALLADVDFLKSRWIKKIEICKISASIMVY